MENVCNIYIVDSNSKSSNYMKFRLKALNYNKLRNNSSNYSYFELDPS